MEVDLRMMESQEAVEKHHQDALETLVAKVKQGQIIIAAILSGSLSYDQIWGKSDIDLEPTSRDGKGKSAGYNTG